jgi:transposase
MSTSPYSVDLREKVINFIEDGNSQVLASKIFKISKAAINRWCVKYRSTGIITPKKRLGAKPSIDVFSFVKYVQENANLTSEEIGKHFGMSASGSRYWLKKLGYSYKKKLFPMWRQTKKSEINIKKI